MRFTMAQPEVSCHPEALLPGARSVVSAALCYYAPGPEPGPGEGRLPRYTWKRRLRGAAGEARRARPPPRRLLPRARRRQPACRPRGRGARRRRLLRQEHDADHAAGTARGSCSARSSPTSRSSRRRRSSSTAASAGCASTPARPARSTSRGRWTRTGASPTGRRRPRRSPRSTASRSARWSTAATSARTSARGTAASSGGAADARRPGRRGRPSRSSSGCAGDGEELVRRYDRLYVPRNDPRYLRRNALVALGKRRRAGRRRPRRAVRRRRGRAAARARRVGAAAPAGAGGVSDSATASWPSAGWRGFASAPSRSRSSSRRSQARTRRAARPGPGRRSRVLAAGAAVFFYFSGLRLGDEALGRLRLAALAFDFADRLVVRLRPHLPARYPIRQVLILVLIEAAFRYGIRGGLGARPRERSRPGGVRVAALRRLRRQRTGGRTSPSRSGSRWSIALIVGWLVQRWRSEAARALDARRPRRSCSATSSGAGPTCSRPPTAARGRSARRSSSTTPSARSSASCAA